MPSSPIAQLAIKGTVNGPSFPERSEAVYGGYMNARGDVVLFAKDSAYHVNFKNHILRQRPPLNQGAQARYDVAEAGQEFVYANKTFRRLSLEQIEDICNGNSFRIGSQN